MPSYTIHLAVAYKYIELKNGEEDRSQFLKGVIAPDLLEKPASHYGPASSQPGVEQYIAENGLESSFNRGYCLHLMTDKLFHSEFLKLFVPELSKEIYKDIYNDYDKLNRFIIDRYGVELMPEIKNTVGFIEGTPVILSEDTIVKFIEAAAQIGMQTDIPEGELLRLINV